MAGQSLKVVQQLWDYDSGELSDWLMVSSTSTIILNHLPEHDLSYSVTWPMSY
jgi:hypothetical protein